MTGETLDEDEFEIGALTGPRYISGKATETGGVVLLMMDAQNPAVVELTGPQRDELIDGLLRLKYRAALEPS
jgi:hypothetical protein